MERWSVLPLTRYRARLLQKVCIPDACSTDLCRSSACRSGESDLPACAAHLILIGAGALSGHRYLQASTVVLLSVLACPAGEAVFRVHYLTPMLTAPIAIPDL